jgi:hypothetical protein
MITGTGNTKWVWDCVFSVALDGAYLVTNATAEILCTYIFLNFCFLESCVTAMSHLFGMNNK